MVITLVGDDSARLESRLKSTLAEHVPDLDSSFNLSELNGATFTFDDLHSMCDALPFFGGDRVVVVKGFLRRFSDKDADDSSMKVGTADLLKALKTYLPMVPESTVLIFVDRRRLGAGAAQNLLKASTRVEEFNLPAAGELPAYIQARAKEQGVVVERQAAQLLALAAADQPNRIVTELDKLIAYKGDERRISEADVRLLVEIPLDVAVWDLTDSMFRHDSLGSLRALRSLLERGQVPQQIVGAIASQYRHMTTAEEYKGSSPDRLASATGMKPFVARKSLGALKGFKRGEPRRVLRALCDLDERYKTGKAELESALELLVVEACARRL
ncbi:MAG: DNA polymerase III subunit delta [Chloroflexia bacterium]